VLADRDRWSTVHGQPPDRGAQPVGADDQVELATAAVVEGDLHRPIQPLQGPDGAAQRTGTPSRRTSCRSARDRARPGPMAPHSSPRSISARRRPRWSSSRWRGISTARAATAGSRPSACRGADAVRWQVNAGPGHLPAAGPLDHLGASPAWPSTLAGARPPSPPPTTRICACFIPSPQWLTCRLSARVLAARTVFRRRARPGVPPAGCRLPVARVGRCRDAAPPGVARPAPRLG
jgi:hypothetical protein